MSDTLLIVWLIASVAWDFAVFAPCTYFVFVRHHSGWWFVFAIFLTYSPSLLAALKKRFQIPND
jgi:hypothetical protein